MKNTSKLIIFIFTLLAMAISAYALSPREELQQMVQQLQKTPNDSALREQIIKLSANIKPALTIPEDARRAFVRGNATMGEAKIPEEYARAVQLYNEALLIAPWWGDPYFNLAKAHELRQEYDSAILGLKLFLLTGTAGNDARQAQDHIYVLEEKRDRQAKIDETKKRAEVQKLQRQTWAKDLVRWMSDNYGRSLLSGVEVCYCTDEAARGPNWRDAEAIVPGGRRGDPNLSKDWSRLGKTLSFSTAGQNNDEIVFSAVGNNGVMSHDFCGTVNGPQAEDIQWKACGGEKKLHGYGQTTSARFMTTSGGKPMVKIKYGCYDGQCAHANLILQ